MPGMIEGKNMIITFYLGAPYRLDSNTVLQPGYYWAQLADQPVTGDQPIDTVTGPYDCPVTALCDAMANGHDAHPGDVLTMGIRH